MTKNRWRRTTIRSGLDARLYLSRNGGDDLSLKPKIDPEKLKREAVSLREEAEKLLASANSNNSSRRISGLDFIVEKNLSNYVSPIMSKSVEKSLFSPTDGTTVSVVSSRSKSSSYTYNDLKTVKSSTNNTIEEIMTNKNLEFSFERDGYRYVMVREDEVNLEKYKDKIQSVQSFLNSYQTEEAWLKRFCTNIGTNMITPAIFSQSAKNIGPALNLAVAKLVSLVI